MAIDGAILRAMQAAGASVDIIIAAVEADAALANERTEMRRAKDAERQRRHRASRNVTVTECDSTDSVTDPALSRPPNEINSNPPTHTHPDMTTRPRKANPFPKPEWADPQVWADWMDVRRAKGGRNTATAYAGFLASIERETDDEWPPGRLLAHAVSESWKSIHRPQEFRNGRSNITELRQHRQQSDDRRSSLTRACDDALDYLG